MLLSIVSLVTILKASEALYPQYDHRICSRLPENSAIGIPHDCYQYYICYFGIAYLDDCRKVCDGCQFDFRINDCNYKENVNCVPGQFNFLKYGGQNQMQQMRVNQVDPQTQAPQQNLEIQSISPIFQAISHFEPINSVAQIQPISIIEEIVTNPSVRAESCDINFAGFHPDRYINLSCTGLIFETSIAYNEFSKVTQGAFNSKLECDLNFKCDLQIEISLCMQLKIDLPSKAGLYNDYQVTVFSTC